MSDKKINNKNSKQKLDVLFAMPVIESQIILESFLISISSLDTSTFNVHYFFVNGIQDCQDLLNEFKEMNENTTIINRISTEKDSNNIDLIEKDFQKFFRGSSIDYASKNGFDYVFFSDCNVTFNPSTVRSLISSKKDLVSTISWYCDEDKNDVPNVRAFADQLIAFPQNKNDIVSEEDLEFYNSVKKRGIYKVGYFSGCFLISVDIIKKGIDFNEIYNIVDDDIFIHMSLKASVLDVDIYVDTNYPIAYMSEEDIIIRTPDDVPVEIIQPILEEEKIEKVKKKSTKKPAKKSKVTEETPALEEMSVVEETPVVEEISVVEDTPVVEEISVVEETPVVEEISVIEETPVVEEINISDIISNGEAIKTLFDQEEITKEVYIEKTIKEENRDDIRSYKLPARVKKIDKSMIRPISNKHSIKQPAINDLKEKTLRELYNKGKNIKTVKKESTSASDSRDSLYSGLKRMNKK
ncbi:MAG: hypothetical protein KFW09_03000 [Oscillospiraceae bacterium]|nr:hypothetical protein [Oscillospiraceae bacterium]